MAEAAKPALGQAGFVIVSFAALLATLSAINATIYGNARLGFTLAKDGELPELLEGKVWHRPVSGVLLTTLLSLLLANLVDLQAIAIMGSAGFLVIFAAVNAACVKLADTADASRAICTLAAIACLAALGTLLYNMHKESPHALWAFLAMVGASLVFEIVYPRLSRRTIRLDVPD